MKYLSLLLDHPVETGTINTDASDWYCRFIGDVWQRRRRDLRATYIEWMYTMFLPCKCHSKSLLKLWFRWFF